METQKNIYLLLIVHYILNIFCILIIIILWCLKFTKQTTNVCTV